MNNYTETPRFVARKGGSFVNLPIILFLLGVVFIFIGWRWQSTPNEEAMTALKGLAYLKREIIRVQEQVHNLEDKIQTEQQIELKAAALREIERKEVERKEVERREIERREVERKEIEHKEKSKVYLLKPEDQRARISGGRVEPKSKISPKYQEVIELAAQGLRIPEIAQRLLLSQDAVTMVLQMQLKGVTR